MGSGPTEGIAWEDGLQFKLKFMENQNVGFFRICVTAEGLFVKLGGGKGF